MLGMNFETKITNPLHISGSTVCPFPRSAGCRGYRVFFKVCSWLKILYGVCWHISGGALCAYPQGAGCVQLVCEQKASNGKEQTEQDARHKKTDAAH